MFMYVSQEEKEMKLYKTAYFPFGIKQGFKFSIELNRFIELQVADEWTYHHMMLFESCALVIFFKEAVEAK